MQKQRSDNTTPEVLIRKELHRRGLRYRVGLRPERALRRKADVVFTRARVAVFVDGCFWHKCPEHGSIPSTNQEYWEPKLHRNAERDAETDAYLHNQGWAVVRIWEHEDPGEAADRVQQAVEAGLR
jgi:DNA mismatch endonuclease, patch repair protein